MEPDRGTKDTVLFDQGFDDILSFSIFDGEASIWMALEEVTKMCYIYKMFAGPCMKSSLP